MKYIIRISNNVVVKPDFEYIIDKNIKDIQNGNFQRELSSDDIILKCKATGQKLSSNSAIMKIWLYSNENPIDEIKDSFNAQEREDDINDVFVFYELKVDVSELQNGEYKNIYSQKDVFGNRARTSDEK